MSLRLGSAGRLLQLKTCPLAASQDVCSNYVGSVHNDGVAVRGASMSALESFQCTYVTDSGSSSTSLSNNDNDANGDGINDESWSASAFRSNGILHRLYSEFASGQKTDVPDTYSLSHQDLERGTDAFAAHSRCVGKVNLACADIRIPLRDAVVYHALSHRLFVDPASSGKDATGSSSSTHAIAMHGEDEYRFHSLVGDHVGAGAGDATPNFTPESFDSSDLKRSRKFMRGFCRRFASISSGSASASSTQSLFRNNKKIFGDRAMDVNPDLCTAPSTAQYVAGIMQTQKPVEFRESSFVRLESELFGSSVNVDQKRYRFVDSSGSPIMVGCA